MLLFHLVQSGGLGMASVKHKANAYLIRTFLELAINPNYLRSQYLSMLYNKYVLSENFQCPPPPPYYNNHFFGAISKALNEGKDIIRMSTKQWYYFLLNRDLFEIINDDGTCTKRLCRSESLYPDIDWPSSWRKLRLPSLSSETVSFKWKLVHDIVITEERVSSTLGTTAPVCRFGCNGYPIADQVHCFFKCVLTKEVGDWLHQVVSRYKPTSEVNILMMEIPENEALIWVTATTLHFCWNKRTSKSKVDVPSCLAFLTAKSRMLDGTHHSELVNEIAAVINQEG